MLAFAVVRLNVRCGVQLNKEESEEYGMEDAAFGPGPGDPHQEARLEDGVLYQALQEEANGPLVSPALSELATLCRTELKSSGEAKPHGACIRYAGFFGWLKNEVKSGWKYLKKAAKSTWKYLKGSVENTFKTLGYGDLVCYEAGCRDAVAIIYDGYKCAIGDDCEGFGADLGEYLAEKK